VPTSILLKGWWLTSLALVEIVFGLAWSQRGLWFLCSSRLWALILAVVVLGSLLIGEPSVTLGPLGLSREGFEVGLEMAGRALTLTLAFDLGIGSLTLSDFVAVFDRMGLRGLGFATALALNLLGTLREMVTVTLQTIYLRGGMQRPWKALRLFLITTVANTLRYRDEIVNAATSRAFDPNDGQSLPLPLLRADLWLLAMLTGCTAVLLSLGMH
jgi:energy-coupling factor transporter transmembrane protein EcfT